MTFVIVMEPVNFGLFTIKDGKRILRYRCHKILYLYIRYILCEGTLCQDRLVSWWAKAMSTLKEKELREFDLISPPRRPDDMRLMPLAFQPHEYYDSVSSEFHIL